MEYRYPSTYKLSALLNRPFNADLSYLLRSSALLYCFHQGFRKVNGKGSRQGEDLVFCGQWFYSRNNGYQDTGFATGFLELEKGFVVEKHLGDNVFCTGIYLLLQVANIA